MTKINDDKYIIYLGPNKYRILIKVNSKKKNLFINHSETFHGTLTETRKRRNELLKELGIELDNKNDKTKYKAISKYIYDYGNDKYRILIKKKGKVVFSQYYDNLTLPELESIRDEELAKIKLYGPKKIKDIYFRDYRKLWYDNYATQETAYNTYTKDHDNLRLYINDVLDNYKLSEIDPLTIQKLFNDLKVKKKSRKTKYDESEFISPVTINEAFKTLRKMLNKAVEWGYIEKSPMQNIKAPKVTRKEKEAFNMAELKNIVDLLAEETNIVDKLAIYIPLFTGLRRGEIVGLKTQKIDLEQGIIKIKNSAIYNKELGEVVDSDTKTPAGEREIPIPPILVDAFKEYFVYREQLVKEFKLKYGADYNPPDNIFLSRFGKIMHPATPYKKWCNFRDRNGIEKHVTLHGIRHSYCSLQINNNKNLSITDIQYIMGHANLFTTIIYTHRTEEKKEAVISVFQDFTNQKKKKFSFESVLSLCLETNYTSTDKIMDVVNFMVDDQSMSANAKIEICKNTLQEQFPNLANIKNEDVNLYNVWDWLERQKQIYGNEFEVSKINSEAPKQLVKKLNNKSKEDLTVSS